MSSWGFRAGQILTLGSARAQHCLGQCRDEGSNLEAILWQICLPKINLLISLILVVTRCWCPCPDRTGDWFSFSRVYPNEPMVVVTTDARASLFVHAAMNPFVLVEGFDL